MTASEFDRDALPVRLRDLEAAAQTVERPCQAPPGCRAWGSRAYPFVSAVDGSHMASFEARPPTGVGAALLRPGLVVPHCPSTVDAREGLWLVPALYAAYYVIVAEPELGSEAPPGPDMPWRTWQACRANELRLFPSTAPSAAAEHEEATTVAAVAALVAHFQYRCAIDCHCFSLVAAHEHGRETERALYFQLNPEEATPLAPLTDATGGDIETHWRRYHRVLARSVFVPRATQRTFAPWARAYISEARAAAGTVGERCARRVVAALCGEVA